MKRPKILDQLANWFGYIKQVRVSGSGGIIGSPYANAPRKQKDYLAAYKRWVYACVKARAQDVSMLKLHLYRRKNSDGEVEEVDEHEVLSLLRSVNPWTTYQQLIEYTQTFKDLAGEAFWYLVRGNGKDPVGPITQIWLLRPDWMTIETDATKFITGYIYRPAGGDEIKIPVKDVIHFKEFNPLDTYRGMSAIAAAAEAIDSEDFAARYKRAFFQNSAVPSVVLQTEQKLDEAIIKRMREQWYAEYGGPDKAHKIAILEGGLEINPFTVKNSDMELLEGMKADRDTILAIFQTPKTVLGMTEDVTVSNAEATDYIFQKRVVKPLMRKLVDVMNEFLLINYGDDLFFDFEDPVPENVTAKLEKIKTAFSVGAMTPNEVRVQMGMDEVEGLDNFYLPFSVSPITGEIPEGQPEEGEQKAIAYKIKPRMPDAPHKTIRRKIKDDLTKAITGKVAPLVLEAHRKILEKNEIEREDDKLGKSQWSDERQENHWKAMVTKAINWEGRYKKAVKDILERQERETITRLHATQKALSPSDVGKILFELETENKISASLILPLVRSLMEDVGNDALDEVGLPEKLFDSNTEAVKQFLNSGSLKGVKAMNKFTKAQVRKVLAAAISEGTSIADTARSIRKVFADATVIRSERIARTETLKATNRATVEAYKQSNVVVSKQWYTAVDERVCQWCGPLHGKTKALDNPYFQEGETFIGKEGGALDLSFDEIGTPPLHPNCRCTIVPILRS